MSPRKKVEKRIKEDKKSGGWAGWFYPQLQGTSLLEVYAFNEDWQAGVPSGSNQVSKCSAAILMTLGPGSADRMKAGIIVCIDMTVHFAVRYGAASTEQQCCFFC